MVYDDYGHHPTAIRETLAAVRQREPGRRVWAVYEPLTFHRTAAMLAAVRRRPRERRRGGDRRHLGRPRPRHDDRLGRGPGGGDPAPAARASRSWRRARSRRPPTAWPRRSEPGDVVLVMGGGASYRIGERLLARLEVTR